MTPALCIFMLYVTVLVTSLFFPRAFYMLTAALTFITMLWISNLALSSIWGAIRLRKATRKDWHAMLEEAQKEQEDKTGKEFGAVHIVILPNYCENKNMMKDTLENLGCSPMALESVIVVLAMEEREGPKAKQKA